MVFRSFDLALYSYAADYGNDKVQFEFYSQDSINYCTISGTTSMSEKNLINWLKPIVSDYCIVISYAFIRKNGDLTCFQPRVEADWENKNVEAHQIANPNVLVEKNQSADSLFDFGTLGMIQFDEKVSITLTTLITPEEIDSTCMRSEAFSFIAHELYTALGTENIRSKYFHLYAIIEYCEDKYKDMNGSIKLFSLEEKKKIQEFFTKNFEDGEYKYNRINETIDHTTNKGRSQKLLNILNAMNIREIALHGKNLPLDTTMLKRLSNLRGKLFHGNDVNDSELVEPISILFGVAIGILDYIKANETEKFRIS